MAAIKIQFYDNSLGTEINQRARPDADGSVLSHVSRRDLQRFYDMYALTLPTISLSVGEASLLVDALNGTFIDLNTAQVLEFEVEDALDELAKKWEVAGEDLVAKIRDWSLLQRMSVLDAVERFWCSDGAGIVPARLIHVGLVQGPRT